MEHSNILYYIIRLSQFFLTVDVSFAIIEAFIVFAVTLTETYPSINFDFQHSSIIITKCSKERHFGQKLRFIYIMTGRYFITNG